MAEILAAVLRDAPIDIGKLMRRPWSSRKGSACLRLIDMFRREGIHFAVVVDEYGTTEGIVTAIDILTGVAGALPERGEASEAQIVRRDDGSWLVDGMIPQYPC